MRIGRKRTWIRWLVRLLIAGGVLVVLVLIGWGWIAPAFVRARIHQALSEHWRGEVVVGRVALNLREPLVLDGVSLRDPDGHEWLGVGSVRVHLRDWPGIHPVVEEVVVDWLRVDGRIENGQVPLPLRLDAPTGPPADPSAALEYVDLLRVAVERIDLAAADPDHVARTPPLRFDLTRAGGGYRFALAPLQAGREGEPVASGTLDDRGVALRLNLRHRLTRREWTLAYGLVAPGVPATEASGGIDVDAEVRIPWTDPNAPIPALALREGSASGRVTLDGWDVAARGRPIVQGLGATVRLLGRGLSSDDLSGRTPGGRVTGSLSASLPLERSPSYRGEFRAERVALAAVSSLLPAGARDVLEDGLADVQVTVRGEGFQTFRARGQAAVDASVSAGPVRRVEGRVAYHLGVEGIDANGTPANVTGEATLSSTRLDGAQGPLAEVSTARVVLAGGGLVLEELAARALGGELRARGRWSLRALGGDGAWRLDAQTPEAVSLARAARLVGAGRWVVGGTAEANVTLTGTGARAARLGGLISADADLAARGGAWASSRLRLDVGFSDLASLSRGQAWGTVDILDASVGDRRGRWAGVSGAVRLAGRRADANGLAGESRFGPFGIDATAAISERLGLSYRAVVRADRLLLDPLAGEVAHLRGGRASGRVRFAHDEGGRHVGEGALAFDAQTRAGAVRRVAGRLAASAAIDPRSGRVDCVHLRLSEGRVDLGGRLVVDGIGAVGELRGRRLLVRDAGARTPFGSLEGALAGRLTDGGVRYAGSLHARRVDLAALSARLAGVEVLRDSVFSATARFEGDERGRLGVRVSGRAAVGSEAAGLSDGHAPITSEGGLDAEVRVAGLFGGDRPGMYGRVRLAGWRVSAGPQALLDDLGLTVAFDGSTVELTDLSAVAGGGGVHAIGRAELDGNLAPASYRLDLRGQAVDAAALLAGAGLDVPLRSARTSFGLGVRGEAGGAVGVRLEGRMDAETGLDVVPSASGSYGADIELRDVLAGVSGMGVHGTGRLEGWRITGRHGVLLEDLGVSLLMLGRSADASSLRATLAGGRVRGWARVDVPRDLRPSFLGSVWAEEVKVDRLMRLLDPNAEGAEGTLAGAYAFRARGVDLVALRGSGAVVFVDSEPVARGPLGALLSHLEVRPGSRDRFDARAGFEQAGKVVTIRRGRLAMPQMAVVIEPGGTVDLESGAFDAHVIAAVLGDIDQFFGGWPVLNLTSAITRNASRLRVSGEYHDPSSVRIRKEALSDLREGTAEFFGQAVKSGGNLVESVGQTLRQTAP